ncbi:hypothetical protein FF80_01636 [Devosia sp. LC5]|uniref:DUF2244 domain-containing protein n=1 Tax=Devosia sp. LC5 TaxID=1502724 RepID=UPI0004E462B4|nr:DUF2244 domain-containing protein [Devosia sp. LC5]KFC68683.1 hypothetical protein FF80_01636 [Devosia sp. LC5]
MPMQATTTSPLFAAELTPHRMLGRGGMQLVIGLGALLILSPLLLAFSAGIGPLLGFIVLDMIAIGATLFFASRQGKRREIVRLWSDQLEVVSVDAKGDRVLRRFNPKSVRLVLDRDVNEKTLALHLRANRDEMEIGAFLNGDDKASFAKVFGTALRKARA